MREFISAALITFLSVTANALPLVWRADWPGSKPVETLVHRGTDIEFQPQWYINGVLANSTNWTFTTFVQTNSQATGEWFGPLPGAAFSHTNDIGAAFYNVMVRAQMPGGGVNYTAFARLRMLDSPGFAPGELPLPVPFIDFSKVVALNAPWLLPSATNDIGTIKVELGSISNSVSTLSAATATNSADIATINSKIPSAASQSNQLADKAWIDDEIDTYAAYYITYTATGAAFPTRATLLNATVVYSGGAVRTPTRNDYAVVLADEAHGGAEWRYIYTVAAGATSGQWDAQYPIETNDYDGLSNKPQINGVSLSGNKTGADLGVLDLAGGEMTGTLAVDTRSDYYSVQLGGPTHLGYGDGVWWSDSRSPLPGGACGIYCGSLAGDLIIVSEGNIIYLPHAAGTLALSSDISAAALSATNYTDASISATSPAFSNAVLSVGLGIDTNTVAVINELVDSAHDLPVSGATSVGALLLALAAAVAALKKNLRYSYNAATVSSGTTPTVIDVADRAINTATLGSSVTAATVTLPAATTDRARDFFIDLTIEATTAPTLTFIDPATNTTANVTFGADSLADIDTGKNAVLFTEFPNYTWIVSVKHEEVST